MNGLVIQSFLQFIDQDCKVVQSVVERLRSTHITASILKDLNGIFSITSLAEERERKERRKKKHT